jgi:hypothetical protein
MQSTYNPYRKWVILCGFLLALTLAISLADFFWIDDGNMFAISGVSFFLCLVPFYFSWKTYKEVADLLGGRTLIAHWQYTPDEWARYAASENARQDKSESGGWLIPALVTLALVGGFYYLIHGMRLEWQSLPVFIAVPIIIFGVAGYRQWKQNPVSGVNAGQPDDVPQAYIATKGVWINKRYFSFSGQTSFNVSHKRGDPSFIKFTWQTRSSSKTGTRTHYHTLRLPVPRSQAAEIDKVLTPFGYKR